MASISSSGARQIGDAHEGGLVTPADTGPRSTALPMSHIPRCLLPLASRPLQPVTVRPGAFEEQVDEALRRDKSKKRGKGSKRRARR